MEIERKYLIKELPSDIETYDFHIIEQGYLCTEPVIRIRRQNEEYFLTHKSKGLLAREETNLPLTEDAYNHLLTKIDGIIIRKKRYLIPLPNQLMIELDKFETPYENLLLAEVEFCSIEEANAFVAPVWFGDEVTMLTTYHNNTLSKGFTK
jgi:Uncharacterized protein conserved in bacteria